MSALPRYKGICLPKVLLLFAILVWSLSCAYAQTEKTAASQKSEEKARKQIVAVLELGKPVERELDGGGSETFAVKVKKGQFLHAVVEQKGIDVVLSLIDPRGKVLVEADSPNGAWGPEPASLIAETSGTYRAAVKSLDKNAPAGKYAITITDLRKPGPEDEKRIAAETSLFTAASALAETGPDSASKAIALFEEAAARWLAVHDYYEEALCWQGLGKLRLQIGGTENYKKALDDFDRALRLQRTIGDISDAAVTLNDMGSTYESMGELRKAIEYFNQALPLEREVKNITDESVTLQNIGVAWSELGEKRKALEYYNHALSLQRTVDDRPDEATSLNDIGMVYSDLGEKQAALDNFNEALGIERAVGDRPDEAVSLNNIGGLYDDLGEKQKALEYYNQALQLRRVLQDRLGEATTLTNIGKVFAALAEEQKALDDYNQALGIQRAVGDRSGEAVTLNNIGSLYQDLDDKEKALTFYNQALELRRAVGDRSGEAVALINIGTVYNDLNERQKALEYLRQALLLSKAVEDPSGEAVILNNIGGVYLALGESQKALEYFNEALPLRRAVGDRSGEAATLANIGKIYEKLGEGENAADYFIQALSLSRAVKEPLSEGPYFHYLSQHFKEQKNVSLAILFGKQAVNAYQQVRKNIQGLDKSLQKSFLESKADTYRDLGDLLIAQGRLAEAQQVLDLLKEEEYFEFVRGGGNTMEAKSQPVPLNPEEQSSHEAYEKIAAQITAVGMEYAELRAKPSRTPEEEARLSELKDKLTLANQEMGRFFKTLYVEFGKNALANQSSEKIREEASGMQSIVRELGPGTVALYTLVGETHYSVIVITASTMQAREYAISATDLRKKVAAFLEALKNPASDPLPASQELYKILFAPIAGDLKGAKAQTLMWSLNDVLRYVPVAALHDGKQYLVENYRNAVITPASIARLKDKVDVSDSSIAGMGVSKDYDGLGALAAVPEELKHIVRDAQVQGATGVIPGTMLLDDDFTETRMASALERHYPVVHIASHFVLQAGNETNSYLLLGGKDVGGKGYHLTLAELRDDPALTFDGTELLTLSACQTGTSGTALNGREVDGLGITAQQKGAKAVLASLWSVADESTALLMADFYRQWLGTSGMTKVRALQQAQLDMLHEATANKPNAERGIGVKKAIANQPASSFSHPFYWAPFILIGNWK